MPNVSYERNAWTSLPNTAVVGNRITQTKTPTQKWSFTICFRCNLMKFPTFQCYQTNSKRLFLQYLFLLTLYLFSILNFLIFSLQIYNLFDTQKKRRGMFTSAYVVCKCYFLVVIAFYFEV